MLNALRTCPKSRFAIASRFNLFRSQPASHAGSLVLVQQCSTKSAPETSHLKPVSDTETTWNPIYHFPGIVLTASMKRLKFYPVGLTATTVPICLGLAYADILSVTTAQICGSVGKIVQNMLKLKFQV